MTLATRRSFCAAHDPAGYKQLQRVLHTWSLAVVATNKPGYYQALEDAKNGVGEYVAWEDVVARRQGFA